MKAMPRLRPGLSVRHLAGRPNVPELTNNDDSDHGGVDHGCAPTAVHVHRSAPAYAATAGCRWEPPMPDDAPVTTATDPADGGGSAMKLTLVQADVGCLR